MDADIYLKMSFIEMQTHFYKKAKVKVKPSDRSSDRGFYGKTGFCDDHGLTNKKCACGKCGVLSCEYDDTPGFRETAYFLFCPDCEVMSSHTSILDNVITSWEEIAEIQ
jgi:hypothetical protein